MRRTDDDDYLLDRFIKKYSPVVPPEPLGLEKRTVDKIFNDIATNRGFFSFQKRPVFNRVAFGGAWSLMLTIVIFSRAGYLDALLFGEIPGDNSMGFESVDFSVSPVLDSWSRLSEVYKD